MGKKIFVAFLVSLLFLGLAVFVLTACETAGSPQATATPQPATAEPTEPQGEDVTPAPVPRTPGEEYPGPDAYP